MKKINLENSFSEVSDKYVEEALETDSKRKLREEVMKEKEVKNYSFWKWSTIALAGIGVVALGTIYFRNGGTILKPIEKSTNKYLSANYGLMVYKSASEYIDENVDLEKLEEGKTLNISSKDLNMATSDEYKYCKSNIEVEKLPYDIYQYSITSGCDNESDDNVKFNVKVYTNINTISGNNTRLALTSKKVNGFEGFFTETTDNHSNAGNISYVEFNNNLNITNLAKLPNEMLRIINISDNGYLLSNNEMGVLLTSFSLYSKDKIEKIWEKDYYKQGTDYTFCFESETGYVFFEFNFETNNNRIVELNKTTGEMKELFTLKNFILEGYNQNDKIFYGRNGNNIQKYDIDGNLIANIDLSAYINDNSNEHIINANENLVIYAYPMNENLNFENKYIINIIDNNNNLLKIIKTGKNTLESKILPTGIILNSINFLDDGFEIVYKIDEYTKLYEKYDKNVNLKFREIINLNYGYEKLKNIGINNFKVSDNLLTNHKFIESLYSSENNGTEIMMMYDYSNSKNVSEDINNTSTSKTEEDSAVTPSVTDYNETDTKNISNSEYDKYIGYWYNNSFYTTDNSTVLHIDSIDNNSTLKGDMYITRTAEFEDFKINMTGNNGSFEANSANSEGTIKGTVELGENYIKMIITSSTIKYLDNNTTLMFGWKQDFNGTEAELAISNYLNSLKTTDITNIELLNYECVKDNNNTYTCSAEYKIYIKNYDKSKCYSYTYPILAGSEPICEEDYVKKLEYFILEKKGNEFKAVDITSTPSEEFFNHNYSIYDYEIPNVRTKNNFGLKISITESGDLVLNKLFDGNQKVELAKLPFYVPISFIEKKDFQTYNGPGFYADYNNGNKQQIRIRIDKYKSGSIQRYGYTWYYFDINGKLIDAKDYE